MSQVHVLHENPQWVAPLEAALRRQGIPYRLEDLSQGLVDLDRAPPPGVYYCRMSASAHARGHSHAASYARALLAWLEAHGRRVVNGSRALELELSKARQYQALRALGIRAPATMVATGDETLLEAAGRLGCPLVVKPDQGGKGLGVVRFDSMDELRRAIESGKVVPGPDGTWIVQRYVRPRDGCIIRNEYVGGRLLYALQVDTSGGFGLCPADGCEPEDSAGQAAAGTESAPTGAVSGGTESPGYAPCETSEVTDKFHIINEFHHPLHSKYEAFLARNGVEIAGLEFIIDAAGEAWTYDVNVNTNYNAAAERRAGIAGTPRAGTMAVAAFLGSLL